MKKIITLLCVAALIIGTTACGNSAENIAMESTTEVTTEITTTQATTKATTKVTTTEKTITTTSNVDTILNSSATINELSFGISSEWDHSSNDNRESWYANDRGMIMLMSFDDPSFSEISDETLFSETASIFYEESKNNNGNTDFSEAQNLKIAGCPAVTFDYAVINDDYNTKIRAFYIFHNGCVYAVFIQMSVQGEPSELSYCVDKIIDSMAFKESTTEAITEPPTEQITYSAGTYKVGTDIPAGEYCIFAESHKYSGYYCVNSDSTGDFGSIIGNDNFDYNAFVTVYDGQYIELSRAIAVPVSAIDGVSYKIDTSGSGTFRVGVDIPAGEYKLNNDSEFSGYYCVYNSSDPHADIVTNDNFKGQTYITVSDGQYLLLSRCKIEK